jgi:protein-arginine kinase activator protein McsA
MIPAPECPTCQQEPEIDHLVEFAPDSGLEPVYVCRTCHRKGYREAFDPQAAWLDHLLYLPKRPWGTA